MQRTNRRTPNWKRFLVIGLSETRAIIHHTEQTFAVKINQRKFLFERKRDGTKTRPRAGDGCPHSASPLSNQKRHARLTAVLFSSGGGFRPVMDGGAARSTPPLFFPPHLASHISSQFSPPLFPALKGKQRFTAEPRTPLQSTYGARFTPEIAEFIRRSPHFNF